jgi:hypothetical protein
MTPLTEDRWAARGCLLTLGLEASSRSCGLMRELRLSRRLAGMIYCSHKGLDESDVSAGGARSAYHASDENTNDQVKENLFYACTNAKSTFPALTAAPPMHVDLNGLSPHTALAALTQPSHLPFVMSIVCPWVAALSSNLASPEAPDVDVGWPPHCSMVPAMPPQIWRRATLILCEFSWLERDVSWVLRVGGRCRMVSRG